MEFTTQLWAAFSNNPTREKANTYPRCARVLLYGIVTLLDTSFQRIYPPCASVRDDPFQDYNSEAPVCLLRLGCSWF